MTINKFLEIYLLLVIICFFYQIYSLKKKVKIFKKQQHPNHYKRKIFLYNELFRPFNKNDLNYNNYIIKFIYKIFKIRINSGIFLIMLKKTQMLKTLFLIIPFLEKIFEFLISEKFRIFLIKIKKMWQMINPQYIEIPFEQLSQKEIQEYKESQYDINNPSQMSVWYKYYLISEIQKKNKIPYEEYFRQFIESLLLFPLLNIIYNILTINIPFYIKWYIGHPIYLFLKKIETKVVYDLNLKKKNNKKT